ncbi:hypothetical protein EVAR_57812_1 [Eumeta japonica]|uniref:Uncharacterized protein n=1 Tax=Eumeta variegata TaxID=151549 RepID=A0A4C1Z939_EUMVA|nr:hypothetical protein EVAR_57812_1 [Eumeta japonica]
MSNESEMREQCLPAILKRGGSPRRARLRAGQWPRGRDVPPAASPPLLAVLSKLMSIPHMTTSQIEAENTQMTNDLYRLLKKYSGLRNLIRELKVGSYLDTSIGVHELESLPNIPPLHDAQGHDQGHHARPRLHGGLPRGGPIARGAQVNGHQHARPGQRRFRPTSAGGRTPQGRIVTSSRVVVSREKRRAYRAPSNRRYREWARLAAYGRRVLVWLRDFVAF